MPRKLVSDLEMEQCLNHASSKKIPSGTNKVRL